MDNFFHQYDEMLESSNSGKKKIIQHPGGIIFRFKIEQNTGKFELLYIGNHYEELIGIKFDDKTNSEELFINLIHPDDRKQFLKIQKKALENIELFEMELRIVPSKDNAKWIYIQAQPIIDEPNFVQWDGFIYDITARKVIEQELLFAKEFIDKNRNPIYWFNEDTEIIYCNMAACEMLGYTKNELYNRHITDLSDDYTDAKKSAMWQSIKKKKIGILETFHKRKDGKKIPVEVRANFFSFGKEELISAFVTDISERFEANKKLIYRQEFEKLLLNISTRFINIPIHVVDQNIDSALIEVCSFLGTESAQICVFNTDLSSIKIAHFYSRKEFHFEDIVNTEFIIDKNARFLKMIQEHKSVTNFKYNALTLNEKLRSICTTLEIKSCADVGMFYQNKLIGFIGIGSEIIDRYWSEDELNMLQIIGDIFINAVKRKESVKSLIDSEQAYREIFNTTSEALTIHNAETGIIEDVNDSMLKMFGLTYYEAIKSSISEISNTEAGYNSERSQEMIKMAREEPQIFEWQAKRKNGEFFWTEISIKKAIIHRQTKILAAIRDISERKKTEELLKESEEKYRMIIESQNDLIIKIDTDNKFIFLSPSFCRLFDKTEEQFLGEDFLELIHEEDRFVNKLAMEKLYKPPYTCFLEQRAITKDGWRWLSWNHTAILDQEGNVTEIIGIGRDITYQKMVENALRESEERFRSIVQNLSDVVFLIDEKGIVKYVTPSCNEYLGLEMLELLGKNITDLIHPDDSWLVEENLHTHLSGSDVLIPYEIRMKHTISSWRTFEVKSHNMLSHPAVRGIVYTISDITERKLMEKQVLDAIIKTEEKERERFAKDLHDDLGPLLSSIKMYIGMLNKAETKEKREYIVNNLNDIVKEAIATTKEVSNDMNPHVLNNYGLVSALELFIKKISTDIEIDFEHGNDNARYSTAIELSLYRIVKELINNTLKHAQATKISVKIKEKDAKLSLFYEDNGQGIPESTLKGIKTGGMGLSNIISRAKSLNASYNFHTNITPGFKFELHVPLIQE